jgi:hypothetical protein
MHLARRLLKDLLIVTGGTLFLLFLCATLGITNSTPPSTSAADAAEYRQMPDEDQEWFSDGVPQSNEEKAAQHSLDP